MRKGGSNEEENINVDRFFSTVKDGKNLEIVKIIQNPQNKSEKSTLTD